MAYISKPLGDELVRNLRRLQGEFRRVESKVRRDQLLAILLILLSVACFWALSLGYERSVATHRLLAWAAYGIAGSIGGARAWYEAGAWYKFGSGQVQKLSRAGVVRWEEEAVGIVGGTLSTDTKDNAFLTLRWAHSEHRVNIYPSMAAALKTMEAPRAPPSEPLDLEAAMAAASDAHVGPAWRCRSCGEENPGTFEMCWKCLLFGGPSSTQLPLSTWQRCQ